MYVCMYVWMYVCTLVDTETDCAQNSHESPPTFPASQLAQTLPLSSCQRQQFSCCQQLIPEREDPRPTPLLPALQLASFPPSPATDRHHSLNPDFLNYPKPLFIFSRSYLFALFPSCFTYYHVHTLFPSLFAESTPLRSSRLPVLPSFSHHLAEEGKDYWAPVGSCVCCKVPTTSTGPFKTRWRAVT